MGCVEVNLAAHSGTSAQVQQAQEPLWRPARPNPRSDAEADVIAAPDAITSLEEGKTHGKKDNTFV